VSGGPLTAEHGRQTLRLMTASYSPFAATRARRLEERRAAAVQALRAAEPIVRAAGGRMLVFGSLVEGGFHERSDIDVAILGLDGEAAARVATEVDVLLSGFVADVIPEHFLPPSLCERVLDHGREPSALD
jgi:predicted nucleotidyltransferase